VLSNFLCDACSVVDPSRLIDAANSELSLHVNTLRTFLQTRPQIRCVIVPPLPRQFPEWFNSYLPCFNTYLLNEVSKNNNGQIQLLAPYVAMPGSFESDGVHLNSESGLSFIQYMINGLDQLLPEENPTIRDGASVIESSSISSRLPAIGTASAPGGSLLVPPFGSSVPAPSLSVNLATSSPQMLQDAVASLTSLTGTMRSEVTARRLQDNLIFARLKEDQDFAFNKNREDRFTLSGLKIDPLNPPPQDLSERKEYFKGIMSALISKACPDLDPPPQVLDVFVNMRSGRGPPFFEVRLESVKSCASFRLAAAQLAKDETSDFANLFIANSVTLTTRVRIEILRAIATSLTTETEEAYVQSFSSRPMLHYQTRPGVLYQALGTNRSYSFVEAVGRWGDKLATVDLLPAYRRARPAFIGCLEQYFVVLKESEPSQDSSSGFDQLFASGSNAVNIGRGRGQGRGRGPRVPRRSWTSRFPSSRGRGVAPPPFFSGGQASLNVRKRFAPDDLTTTPSKKKDNDQEFMDAQETVDHQVTPSASQV